MRWKFQTTSSAVKWETSCYLQACRKVNIQRWWLAGSTCHSVARPGLMSDALSLLDRSQLIKASYRFQPTNRKPSKPWSGLPVVTGKSPAVIATFKTPAARAVGVGAASAPAMRPAIAPHHESTLTAEHVIVPPLSHLAPPGKISLQRSIVVDIFR